MTFVSSLDNATANALTYQNMAHRRSLFYNDIRLAYIAPSLKQHHRSPLSYTTRLLNTIATRDATGAAATRDDACR